ncbi:hypothetical protein CEXT_369961 [Caerostris extrusa]|uniref:Uncharacterized protein n=1 Tax=Caerostris extrusa TaxID=172846 RepID=A0AAV4X3U9_CAEEX|nr:hypothetical protein CEXT_369961 [Caerostris extrusa]
METPMDLEFLDNLESTRGRIRWVFHVDGFQRFLNWADTPAPPVTQEDSNAAVPPVAKKDSKKMLLDEDDWAERVIPAATKDLSKMLEEPIHPDTTQSANMSRNREDFFLLKEEELDDTESPSRTGSGSSDSPKQPSTAGSALAVARQTVLNDPRLLAVAQQTVLNDPRLLAVAQQTVLNDPQLLAVAQHSAKRPSTSGSGSTDNAKPIQRERVHSVITLETAMKKTNQARRPASPIRRPSLQRTPPATPIRRPLYCLAIRKKGFTLSYGTRSASVDNDAWWKRTLTSLLLQKKWRVFLVDSETKNEFSLISQTLTNVQAIKLDPPSDRLVQPCSYCQDKDCHRWLAVREGVRRLVSVDIDPIRH